MPRSRTEDTGETAGYHTFKILLKGSQQIVNTALDHDIYNNKEAVVMQLYDHKL